LKNNKTFAELEAEIKQRNHTGIDDFNGLSPFQMHNIIYSPFESACIVQLNKMNEDDCNSIPIIRLMRILLNEVDHEKGLKLTAVGNIPPKIVKKIYERAEFPDRAIESGIVRINKEDDCRAVVTTRTLLILCGMVKVRNKTMTRTKKCHDLLNDPNNLLRLIWEIFSTKFNICYFDGYPENECGTFAFAYVLYLLHKHGKNKNLESHYGNLYLKAFPFLSEKFNGRYRSKEDEAVRCMAVRMFHRFFQYFGIIDIEEKYGIEKTKIQTTELFTKMIKIHGT
jgi:hypothetical protein